MTNEANNPAESLLPCPFCGGDSDYQNINGWKVRCNECGIATPDSYISKGAISLIESIRSK